MASHLGEKKDIRQFDADIKAMADGILKNAWDADSGYFGYVEHDAEGKALRIFTTAEGANYNMGLDGVTPLVAGIADEAQKEAILHHIFTKGELWSDCGISAVDQRAPYYREDGYWNGTVWMPHQMILWKTMLDLGLPEKARLIADTALENWERECEDSYNCYEHFMIKTGRGGGWYNFSACLLLSSTGGALTINRGLFPQDSAHWSAGPYGMTGRRSSARRWNLTGNWSGKVYQC